MNVLALFNTTNIYLVVLLFIVGLLLIIKGGDFFVDAAVWVAIKSRIPKFIIGATIVSISTTLPELIVSVIGTVEALECQAMGNAVEALGKVSLSVGNAIGSVTANTGIIMGISLCFMPGVIDRKKYLAKSLLLIASVILIFVLSLNGTLSILDSILLLILLIIFIGENVVSAKDSHIVNDTSEEVEEELPQESTEETKEQTKEKTTKKEIVVNILKFIFGVVGIVIGAQLLIDKGTIIAYAIGIPEAIIGLTMVAIGTSLPELVTTISAIAKKQSALSVGNIIGANIIDLCMILPICAFIFNGSFPIANRTIYLDMPVCILLILIGVVPTLIRGKFSRIQGFLLIGLYIVYAVIITVFPNLVV